MEIRQVTLLLVWLTGVGIVLSFLPHLKDSDVGLKQLNVKRLVQGRPNLTIGDTSENIFWFVQVSDIHISKFSGHTRAGDLQRFCEEHLSIISPDFVIASGDLTDAKLADGRGSRQFYEEWKKYRDVVTKCTSITKTQWLDIKGNHDAFNVASRKDEANLFKKYSSQGPFHPSSYIYQHHKPWGRYTIVALDATPDPGPKRPFNFFGHMNKKQTEEIKALARESVGSNLTIWFGHYTTSLVLTENGSGIRALMSDAVAYLCGHLHTLGGLVQRMYARHLSGTLELELGDWRDARRYRVLAVDHDIFSFTDETLGEWPVVLITNPKNARFNSYKEAGHIIANSTHIRVLVFSPNKINNVLIYIDGEFKGSAKHIKGPLFALPWQPSQYNGSYHNIKVIAEDTKYKKEVSHTFSVNGMQLDFPLLPNLILATNIFVLGKLVFWIILCSYIGILLLLRGCNDIRSISLTCTCSCLPFVTRPIMRFINHWLLRLWFVSRTSTLFYPLVIFIFYIAMGPWFVAEIIDGHTGILFIWGMYVNSTFLQGSLSYFYGIFHIVTFNIPLTMFLGYLMHYMRDHTHLVHKISAHQIRHIYIPFLSIFLLHGFITWREFPAAYGSKAMILGPLRTGSLFLAVILFVMARKSVYTLKTT